MAELTQEQLDKTATMPLEELRQLAEKELAETETATGESSAPVQQRDDKGRFTETEKKVEASDEIDNSGEGETEETKPERTIYRKEIDSGDGSGVDVYEAESLEELVDKIAEGKRNANKKIRELSQKVRVEDTRTEQQKQDDEYVIAERLKKEPKKAMKEIITEVIEERLTAAKRSDEVQNNFVNTHPLYRPTHANGEKLSKWVQMHGYSEFTAEGLEKAYQDLSRSGLLELKSEEVDATTETEGKDTVRTEQPKPEATQQRSPKKSSTISTTRRVSAPVVKTEGFNEDEAYKMPLDKLRELAEKQLSANQR